MDQNYLNSLAHDRIQDLQRTADEIHLERDLHSVAKVEAVTPSIERQAEIRPMPAKAGCNSPVEGAT
jgi:hypothetical protein